MNYWDYIFKTCGIIGLLIITKGIFVKKETPRDWNFALGGIFLLVYSAYIRDYIFIVLQAIFIASNIYREYKLKNINFK